MSEQFTIRNLCPEEFAALGRLLVAVYSGLEGFPSPEAQPGYYEMLANIGQFAERKDARVLAAVTPEGELLGGLVYFGDMAEYGAGGKAKTVRNASGIRLLGIDPKFRGLGAGRALTGFCIQLARDKRHEQVILHTTNAMRTAWALYERMGFNRSEDLDFSWEGFPVHGFRLRLE